MDIEESSYRSVYALHADDPACSAPFRHRNVSQSIPNWEKSDFLKFGNPIQFDEKSVTTARLTRKDQT
ncbi:MULTISPECIES: hypothetical protein [Burkholderia]|uniref:hypothetical protein n=1 Tax=Burkholderia TaxID=32008 RepID=UPI00104B9B44|nr:MULTISPECIES: hypothetical protein [Burkholderia]TDA43193.1 hypothetical protein EVG18_33450 [Burkholderia pyrrocinia]